MKPRFVITKMASYAVALAKSTFGLLAEASADVGEMFIHRHRGQA